MNWRGVVCVVVVGLPAACGGGRSQPLDGGGDSGGTTVVAGTTGIAGTTGSAGTTVVAGTAGTGGGGTGGTSGTGSSGTGGTLGIGGGGTGGTAGIGGSGTGGTTGAGGLGGQSVPACLKNLMAACPIDTCVGSGASGDAGTAQCFASGARSQSAPSSTCANPGSLNTLTTVTKPDGSLCYTVDRCCDPPQCESAAFTWKDAAGAVVATGGVNYVRQDQGYRVTCAATGELVSLPFAQSGLFAGACPSGAVCP